MRIAILSHSGDQGAGRAVQAFQRGWQSMDPSHQTAFDVHAAHLNATARSSTDPRRTNANGESADPNRSTTSQPGHEAPSGQTQNSGRTSVIGTSGSPIVEPDSVLGESGRLYHGYHEGKYILPDDTAERDRLDLQHAAIRLVFRDSLFLFPMKKRPKNVLDVATGSGIWAMEFAKQFPSANVLGTDLNAIQPSEPAPPNCAFERSDAEDPWVFNRKFDFIHLRLVCSNFNGPKQVMKQAFDNMNPGGWIEYQDVYPDIGCFNQPVKGTALGQWKHYASLGARALAGRNLLITPHYKQWLIDTGFVDVEEKKMFLPINPWPTDPMLKKAGQFFQVDMLEGIHGMAWKMARASGLSVEEAEEYFAQFRSECLDVNRHFYWPFYVVYGRKPFPEEAKNRHSVTKTYSQ